MISIIIPVKNGEEHITGCLDSIRAMRFPDSGFEVIVVDNGSDDETLHILASHDVTVLHEETPGPYAARNRGADAARGDILAFTDIDCRVDVNWARALQSAMERFDAVCGMSLGADGGEIARLIQLRYRKNIENRIYASPPLPVFDTRNAAVRKDIFQAVGGFDTRLQDIADDLLGILTHEGGHAVGFERNMIITHIHPERLRDVGRRQKRHGRYIPVVRAVYHEDVTRYFPGLNRFGFVDGTGIWCRMAAGAAYTVSASAAWIFALKLRIAMLLPGKPFTEMFFDLFCRAMTVQGIADAGLRGTGERYVKSTPLSQ